MAIGAIGGDGEAGLQQSLAMDALPVMLKDLRLAAVIADGCLLPRSMALRAEGRDVAGVGGRVGLILAQSPVRAVAV